MTIRELESEMNRKGFTIRSLAEETGIPDDCNVELIDGIFYLSPDPPSIAHQKIAGDLFFQIKNYINRSSGRCVPFFAPTAVLLHCDDKTLLLPDVFIVCDQNKLKKQYVWGAPDFVAEILSPSTADYDRSIKLEHYRTAGVRECWLIDPEKEDVAVYFFENDKASPTVYSFEQDIPVNIYSGQLFIRLK